MYITHINQRVIDAQASISTMIPPISNQINIDNIYQVDPYVDEKGIKEIIKNTKHVKSQNGMTMPMILFPNRWKSSGYTSCFKTFWLSKRRINGFW